MKSICVSLETSKALKAADWTKPTVFVWVRYGSPSLPRRVLEQRIDNPPISESFGEWYYAPTAEEVLRELPSQIKSISAHFRIYRTETKWQCSYDRYGVHADIVKTHESLSEAASQMWLWCVSEGHIKTEAKP